MIEIIPEITLDERELQFEFIRAAGPGGQNVNRVATAVQLRFDVAGSPSLPEGVRQRLLRIAGKRLNKAGVLIIEARRHRTQERNRQDAVNRLVRLIRKAAQRPRVRRETKPTQAAQERRLQSKRQRSAVKRQRRPVSRDDE